MKKLTKERVLLIEHKILLEQDLSATFGLPDASNAWLEAYICGVVDMTQAIVEALEDEEGTKRCKSNYLKTRSLASKSKQKLRPKSCHKYNPCVL